MWPADGRLRRAGDSAGGAPYARCMTLIRAPRGVVAGAEVADVWIETDGEVITATGTGQPPRGPDVALTGLVLPGFVDQHCHGGGRGDFFAADATAARTAARIHLERGTTTLVGSLVTAAPDALLDQVRALVPLVAEGVLAGIHLEGPWLSDRMCGAHDPALLRDPDPAEIAAVVGAGGGSVVMATIAPELDGALTAVRQLVDLGVVAAIGHTDCSYERAEEAIAAGATVATHLFNQMPPIHKRDAGAVVALLADPRVVVELIADGVHVDPRLIRFVVRSVGPDRVAGITDAMGAAGAPDGQYLIGRLDVTVSDGVARLTEGGALAGSTLTMDRAFRTLTDAGVGVADASRIVSSTPARAMGFADRGRLEPGFRADLVVLDDDRTVIGVMRAGRWEREPA